MLIFQVGRNFSGITSKSVTRHGRKPLKQLGRWVYNRQSTGVIENFVSVILGSPRTRMYMKIFRAGALSAQIRCPRTTIQRGRKLQRPQKNLGSNPGWSIANGTEKIPDCR